MALKEDEKQLGKKVLTAINYLDKVGGTDALVAANSTVTLLIAAVKALPNTIGSEAQACAAIARGLALAVPNNILSESHGASTIAGLRTTVFNAISDTVPVFPTFAGDLP